LSHLESLREVMVAWSQLSAYRPSP
jgi:hypothetical protein